MLISVTHIHIYIYIYIYIHHYSSNNSNDIPRPRNAPAPCSPRGRAERCDELKTARDGTGARCSSRFTPT